ncbi:MAG TPA: lysophospholipid acyltransferase family protein [Humisphaera sp.]|jgi:1-acyl-sn-glycerol-3-phosphate acyltransferase|nr:lysophospholipid acyltransferase family protein [Humisphaera sp.]
MERSRIWRSLQVIARVASTYFFDIRLYGTRNVPKSGGVLLVSNHQSYLDPVLLAVGLERPLSYMAKSELFRNPLFAWLIRSLNAFPVEQGAGDVGAVKETIHRLQEGHVLNIYPEGTRSEDGQILPIEKGVGLVIRRAKVPVVPAVIDGAYRAWGKSMKFPRAVPVRVMFGPPMELAGLDREQIIQRIDQTLNGMMKDLRAGRIIQNPPRVVMRR